MTDDRSSGSDTSEGTERRKEWIDDAERALEGAGEAIRAAWNASRDSRLSALESAKQAAKQLGEAIERGVDAARTRREGPPEGTEQPTPPPTDEGGSPGPEGSDQETP